jgi:hypothetical protein
MSVAPSKADPAGSRNVLWTIAWNAIPVIGVVAFGWQALPLMAFYWIENLVIGAINAVKIAVSGLTKPMPQPALGLFLAAFFTVHYGMFCFVHGIFVFAIFTLGDLIQNGVEPQGEAFDLLARVRGVLDSDLLWSAGALVVLRVGEFLAFWVGGRAWLETEPKTQMLEPYGRIIVLHLTLFFCAIPVIALGQPMLAVLVLALLKAGLELGMPMFKAATRPAL